MSCSSYGRLIQAAEAESSESDLHATDLHRQQLCVLRQPCKPRIMITLRRTAGNREIVLFAKYSQLALQA